MSIKNFLSYLFKDNDPTSTDLFDANWGNGVTEHLNALLRAPHITISSEDRQAQLNLEGSNYYIGPDGISLGYPADYLTLINMKRDANLVVQLVYSSVGIWTRTVNHNNSSLVWRQMGGSTRTNLTSFVENGWESYGGAFGGIVADKIENNFVRMTGMIRNGNGDLLMILPPELRPSATRMITVMSSNNVTRRIDVYADGKVMLAGTPTAGIFVNLSDIAYTIT